MSKRSQQDDAQQIEAVVVPATGEDGDGGSNGEQTPHIPDKLPVLPIRGTVVFPGTVSPLGVGRPASRRLLDDSLPNSKMIALITQRDEDDDAPSDDGLYDVGVAAMVLKLIRQQDETVTILVHGLSRVRITKYEQRDPFRIGHVKRLRDLPGKGKRFTAAVSQLRSQAKALIEATPEASEQALNILLNIDSPGALADFLAANLQLAIEEKQDLLEQRDVTKRVAIVLQQVTRQLELARLQAKIQDDVTESIGQHQRRAFLREQLKAIQKELGDDGGPGSANVDELRARVEEAQPPDAVLEEANKELDRLAMVPPASPEYSMMLTYLELIAELPWSNASEDNLDLDRARKILDRDHYDLDKVKRRLIEYLAVRKLNPDGRGPILCLIGPPGVGKTSLGKSMAEALGREFVRMSLGGIRDEAEVRGHRRTYIGSMPGRIIQELRRAGTNNPLVMLDELDKLGSDFRGDPASALLEVLDPKQNHAFVDRYLDVPFDLSQIIFVATANYTEGIPGPLRDRMEIIDIAGYTDHDKLRIARKYLVPQQLHENGLLKKQCNWLQSGLKKIINDYTREAGVRELERKIGAVCRGLAAKVAASRNGRAMRFRIDDKQVRDVLGPEKFTRDIETHMNRPGVVMGLAYTPVGGEVLFIEAAAYPGKGNVTLTGHLGDVMKESATAAMSLFKSHAEAFDYDLDLLAKLDVHIHVPSGAVPKDGPSAGVAMYTAIASLLLDKPVRKHIAMTGEITLRGLVLPIGGVKEKTLAAERVGVKKVILPARNERDMEEVDPRVLKKLDFAFVTDVDELLCEALGIRCGV